MEVKTKKSFNNLLESLVEEILDEEELDEITTTGDVEGYNTPMAFTGDDEKGKKKKKRISTNSTGYDVVKEELENKDIAIITLTNLSIKKSSGKNIGNITDDINNTVIRGTPLQNSIKPMDIYLIKGNPDLLPSAKAIPIG